MDSRNFAIGILSTTATMLLVGLFVIQSRPAPAVASGMTVAGGAYTMTVGRDAMNDQDFLYVLHGPTERLIVYRFDPGRRRIEIVHGVDLSMLEGPGQPGNSPSQPAAQRRLP